MIAQSDHEGLKVLGFSAVQCSKLYQMRASHLQALIDNMEWSECPKIVPDEVIATIERANEDERELESISRYISNGAPKPMIIHLQGISAIRWQQAQSHCKMVGIESRRGRGRPAAPSNAAISAAREEGLSPDSSGMRDYLAAAKRHNIHISELWYASQPQGKN